MKLVVKVNRGGESLEASPEQLAAVERAFDAILAESKFTYFDAMLAMDELVHRAEMWDFEPRSRKKPEPFAPFHDERLELRAELAAAADEAAGEPVNFFMDLQGEEPVYTCQ